MNAIKTVAVTGAAGFVGRQIVARLLSKGYHIRALVRDRSKVRGVLPSGDPRVTVVVGDAADASVAGELVRGAQACINVIGIIREEGGSTFSKAHVRTTEALVAAASAAGCGRFLQMSALGVGHDGNTEYRRTKWDGEQVVRKSDLAWTIFRPSMIHGKDGEFIQTAVGWATGKTAPWFFLPYFTRREPNPVCPTGTAPEFDPVLAPVRVEDVAEAFVSSLNKPETVGEIYNLAGPEVLSWPQMLLTIRDGVPGAKKNMVAWGIPGDLAAMKAKAAKVAGLGWALPFDEGMARMGMEDSTASLDKARADLGIDFQPFTRSFGTYAASLGEH
ncbi:MAG TPA: NAD(P)H-binding protein [Phycisphaerales bacterium]|nr:NAD(P)H-binding protein [Phycisphaerales bacterium]